MENYFLNSNCLRRVVIEASQGTVTIPLDLAGGTWIKQNIIVMFNNQSPQDITVFVCNYMSSLIAIRGNGANSDWVKYQDDNKLYVSARSGVTVVGVLEFPTF